MYTKKLMKCKESYPFGYYLEFYNDEGLGVYSEENCVMVQSVFDTLIDELIKLGESGSEKQRLSCFKFAVERLNIIRSSYPELIETLERESFCHLFDEIGVAVGLNTEDYGDSIASEWRTW